MSITMFVFVGYLFVILLTPLSFNLGTLLTFLVLSIFVDLFNIILQYYGGNRNEYSG